MAVTAKKMGMCTQNLCVNEPIEKIETALQTITQASLKITRSVAAYVHRKKQQNRRERTPRQIALDLRKAQEPMFTDSSKKS